ncbi:MAG TPA: tRNA (guanosine(37)-N1)-methyltransferase TrmD, partial [Microbacteriaceae bacterium]
TLIDEQTTVIFPTPAGKLFDQKTAYELSQKKHLVFVCGRYEGIDQRVIDYAESKAETLELSIGDYVINGGEIASVVMIEAITRLLPGVIGNSESLVEESHEGGLVEYPSYTKPASWNDFEVPEVLLSGNHAEIAKWRKQQQLERTKKNRPDLI